MRTTYQNFTADQIRPISGPIPKVGGLAVIGFSSTNCARMRALWVGGFCHLHEGKHQFVTYKVTDTDGNPVLHVWMVK